MTEQSVPYSSILQHEPDPTVNTHQCHKELSLSILVTLQYSWYVFRCIVKGFYDWINVINVINSISAILFLKILLRFINLRSSLHYAGVL